MDPTKALSLHPEITHFPRAGGEICLSPWQADCFPGAPGCTYRAAESPKGCPVWGGAPSCSRSYVRLLGLESIHRGSPTPSQHHFFTFSSIEEWESIWPLLQEQTGQVGVEIRLPALQEASRVRLRSGTQHGRVCAQTPSSRGGCAGGGPWSLCNGNNANRSSGETLWIF